MKGTWHINLTEKEKKKRMSEVWKKGLKRRKLAYETLKKVEQAKKKWQEDSKKWSKELEETIITNLFQ